MASTVSTAAQVVPPHQDFLVTPGGMTIPIGPDARTSGPSRVFDEFHFNIHFGTPNLEAWQPEQRRLVGRSGSVPVT